MTDTNTAHRIKALRLAAGLTQQALATAAGVNISQIQKIESGEIDVQNITLRNAIAISEALGVSPTELVAPRS